jgi:hypothetical protein
LKALYFDTFAGISGDMTLGALIDLGVPVEYLQEQIDLLGLEKVEILQHVVERKGIRGIKVDIRCRERGVVRTYSNIRQLIASSSLPDPVKESSLRVFEILASAEAKIHSKNIDQIHFHELGAVDTIVDIVGFSLGLHYLEVERVYGSPIPTGKGWIRTEHGILPVPPPAVVEILKGVPAYSGEIPTEIVTPTGAAIIKSCVQEFGGIPPMEIKAVGYGAGARDLEIPNLLRLIFGELQEGGTRKERAVMIITNIDDMNPEIYEHVMEKLFSAGASDVWLVPIQMKRTRPAVSLQVLAPHHQVEPLKEIIFRETNTLGLRLLEVEKEYLERDFITVETAYGKVRVKLGMQAGRVVNIAPEYGDCQKLAETTGVPLKEIFELAMVAARRKLESGG